MADLSTIDFPVLYEAVKKHLEKGHTDYDAIRKEFEIDSGIWLEVHDVLCTMSNVVECPCCRNLVLSLEVHSRHMNTQYEEQEKNWLKSCITCFLLSEEYWAERWKEYNESRG